jgi:BASS family bile acid:Na+ symporter
MKSTVAESRTPTIRRLGAISDIVQRHFLELLIGCYAAAALMPGFGLWLRTASIGEIDFLVGQTEVMLPMVLLAALLFNAGLSLQTSQLRDLLKGPRLVVAGLTANLLIPIIFLFAVTLGMPLWHNPDEMQILLVGLALVASMPIAGSSAAWSQKAEGNLALSLGLVVLSTIFCPLTTPVVLDWAAWMTEGEYAQELRELATHGAGTILIAGVLLPSLAGIILQKMIGASRFRSAKPAIQLLSAAVLLLLNYSNAAISLPQAVRDPDWDFLAVILASVVGMCALGFAGGWWIAQLLHADQGQQTSLMFGLGLNNNGAGLVLASMALADQPRIMLPLILYNLSQHLMAGIVDRVRSRGKPNRSPPEASGA